MEIELTERELKVYDLVYPKEFHRDLLREEFCNLFLIIGQTGKLQDFSSFRYNYICK